MSQFTRSTTNTKVISQITGSADNNYGLTEAQMKAKFDEAGANLQTDLNNLMTELEKTNASEKIGYTHDGTYNNVSEALEAIFSAGTGSIPPDNTITTSKIVDGAVSEVKLATALINKINATKIKLVKLDLANPTSVTDNGASGYVLEDKNKYFDLGFTPSAVFIFSLVYNRDYQGDNRNTACTTISTCSYGTRDFTSGKLYDEKLYYGGIAFPNIPCMATSISESNYCFKIEKTGVTLHAYNYYHEYSDGDKDMDNIFTRSQHGFAPGYTDIYCLAIA